MKFVTVLSLVFMVGGQAFASSPEQIFEAGSQLISQFQKDNQMDYILNPIICENAHFEIGLIFSDDFRHSEEAYLIDGEIALKAKTSKLNLVRENQRIEGEYQVEDVTYKRDRMTCVSSTFVLEGVGR